MEDRVHRTRKTLKVFLISYMKSFGDTIESFTLSGRINPHEAKENIHLRPTSISRTLFRFFSFSGTSVILSKSRDTGAAQKKELVCPIQRSTMLACTIGPAAPIGVVLYHHAYIGPILVIPPCICCGKMVNRWSPPRN